MTGPVNNSSLTKAQLAADTVAEQLLQVGIVADQKLMASLTKYPQLEAALQQALNLITSQFSSIINQKYGESAQTVVNNLSQTQINTINSQISTVNSQITNLKAAISTLTTTQTNEQTAVNNDQSALDALTQQITSLTPTVTALNTLVQNDQITVNNDQTAEVIASNNFNQATNQLNFDQSSFNNMVGNNGSLANYVAQIFNSHFKGNDGPSRVFSQGIRTPVLNDLNASPPDLASAQQTVQNFINGNSIPPPAGLNSTQLADLNSLSTQLQVALTLQNTTLVDDNENVFLTQQISNQAVDKYNTDNATLTTDTNNYNSQNALLQGYITQQGQVQTQKSTDQASLDATTATINSDNTQLAGYNSTLSTLQAQLAAAQAAYNNGVAFFNKLTPLEKQMFKELYPGVAFPA